MWIPELDTLGLLGVVAAVSYLVGRFLRTNSAAANVDARRELRRAQAVVRELEGVGQRIRKGLAEHHASIAGFKQRVAEIQREAGEEPWQELSEEAERMLKPTLHLSTQIAHAYDEIRQQTNLLMTFTEVRTDPLTGIRNRRALDECLHTQFALAGRYGAKFSVAIFDIDHFKKVNDEEGHLQGDEVLRRVARLLDDTVRDTDVVARFGGEEFVVLMPETDLEGACIFAERAREMIEKQTSVTVSGGVAQATEGDSADTLVERADVALYGAKTAGRNVVFQHEDEQIRPVDVDLGPTPAEYESTARESTASESTASEHAPA